MTTQHVLAHKQTLVDVNKVLAVFAWLKANNFYHSCNIAIPNVEDLLLLQIIEEDVSKEHKFAKKTTLHFSNKCF